MLNALQGGSSSALSARGTLWADLLNMGLGRRKLTQPRQKCPGRNKRCVSAYQRVPGEVPGRSDSLWITTVYLFILLTLEKENNLIGGSS